MNQPFRFSPNVALALIAAILLCVAHGCGTAHTGNPEPVASAPVAAPLNIMTFNIRYGTALDGDNAWAARRGLFFDTIRAADPDVIGFQEALAYQVKESLKQLDGYKAVYACRDDGKEKGESCAILYRAARFTLDDSGTFWLSDTPGVVNSNTWNAACTRICTWAHLTDTKTHHGFYIFNTHLDHIREEARIKGVALIVSRLFDRPHADEPAFLTGDFNCGEVSDAVGMVSSVMIDTYRDQHPKVEGKVDAVGTFNNFKNKTDGDKIDYIFVTQGVEVENAEIIRTTREGRNASDHFAVTARVRLQ